MFSFFKNIYLWGAWVAQSVKHLTLAQVMISWFMSLSPASDPGACFRFWFPSLSAPPQLMLCLSLKNK